MCWLLYITCKHKIMSELIFLPRAVIRLRGFCLVWSKAGCDKESIKIQNPSVLLMGKQKRENSPASKDAFNSHHQRVANQKEDFVPTKAFINKNSRLTFYLGSWTKSFLHYILHTGCPLFITSYNFNFGRDNYFIYLFITGWFTNPYFFFFFIKA